MKKTILPVAFIALCVAITLVACGEKPENENPSGGEIISPALAGFDQNGASEALFSVSPTKKVRFSRGNLQYQASTGLWRFAEQQYDVIGRANDSISPTYSGWIDLFGYGTSGWNSGAAAYQPYSNSHQDTDYYVNGAPIDLTGNYAHADWGVHNPIANGGNRAGMWRTLTFDEWKYLISTRYEPNDTRVNMCGTAMVMGHPGLVILCDNFVLPDGLSFIPGDKDTNTYELTYNYNVYEEADWRRMEAAGAVFLPSAEMRYEAGTEMALYPEFSSGHYWTSTGTWCSGDAVSVFGFGHTTGGIGFGCTSASNGFSVRLVMDE